MLERCRNVRREEMEITNENGYSIRVVPHPSSAVACELFNWVYRSDVEDRKTVIVFPNSWRDIYVSVAEMCNRNNISARNIHAFCMDEWADEDGNVAPITYGPSLGGHFLREFYLSFREDLRPPLKQMHYYTNENIGCYSDLIDETGDGGADLIISATGWIGHTAFIDPQTKAFQADSLEEFLTLKAGFVDNHRLTVIQNSGGYGAGGPSITRRATPFPSGRETSSMQEITWSVMISATAAATAPGSGWSPGCSSTALFPLMYPRPSISSPKAPFMSAKRWRGPLNRWTLSRSERRFIALSAFPGGKAIDRDLISSVRSRVWQAPGNGRFFASWHHCQGRIVLKKRMLRCTLNMLPPWGGKRRKRYADLRTAKTVFGGLPRASWRPQSLLAAVICAARFAIMRCWSRD